MVRQVAAARRGAGDLKNARKILTSSEQTALQDRIAQLETHTDAEVVCVVATESGRYDRAESFCGLIVALTALLTVEKILSMGPWDQSIRLMLSMQILVIVLGFVAGLFLSSYWHGLRRLFVGKREMNDEVLRSTHQVFAQRRMSELRPKGCMLIYISLFERRLEIRCDQNLTALLPPAALTEIRDAVLPQLKQGQLGAGLREGLARAEKTLSQVMPTSGQPTNRLPNAVVLCHPRPF